MALNALTRTCIKGDHAMIAPDSHVPCPPVGWTETSAIILISPQMGSRFIQYFANMARGGTAGLPLPGVQRAIFVHEGGVRVECGKLKATLAPGGFAWLPPDVPHTIRAAKATRLTVFEKPYEEREGVEIPGAVAGDSAKVKGNPFLGDPDARLKVLLPEIPGFDMAMNVFDFKAGAALPFVECHVMEHGLLMLEGQGVYRLADSWYPVQAGDAIWMASYCPQWFVAYGKGPSSYLYYKDIHRDPLGIAP